MSEIFEKPVEIPKKEKKKRKPMSPEAKAALLKRLADGRAKKKAAKEQSKEVVAPKVVVAPPIEVAPTVKEVVVPVKPKVEKKKRLTKQERTERERSLELSNLRQELEIKKMRNELESLDKKQKPSVVLEPIVEKIPEVSQSKEKPKEETNPVPKKVVSTPPVKIPKVGHYATRSRWSKYRQAV